MDKKIKLVIKNALTAKKIQSVYFKRNLLSQKPLRAGLPGVTFSPARGQRKHRRLPQQPLLP